MAKSSLMIAASLLGTALAAPVAWAETDSEKALDAATFSNSESETQVREEEAMERKDGMDTPAVQSADTAQPPSSAAPAAPAPATY